MLKYYIFTTTVCISNNLVILLYMEQCSRGYSDTVSAPSQKSVTTDSKLLKAIYKLFIMKENICFLPTDHASTTTLYYCAWDNAAEDRSILCQHHHKSMSPPTPNYITCLESYLL